MKRKLLLFLLGSLVICTPAFAGGAGNCIQPLKTTTEHVGMGGAFEYNYMHQRLNDLEAKNGPRDMKVRYLNQVYGKITAGILDNFNAYVKIGGCNYDLEFTDKGDDAKIKIGLHNGIYMGLGANALFPIPALENLSIGCDVQGNFYFNDVKDITRNDDEASSSSGGFYGIDGQNSVYLAYIFDIETIKTSIVPYIGGYQSWMVIGSTSGLEYDTSGGGKHYSKSYAGAFDFLSFGLMLGVDVDVCKYLSFNIEGRFVGETALTTGATFKF